MELIVELNAMRLPIFLGILMALLALETLWPRRRHVRTSRERLATNALMSLFNALIVKLLAAAIVPIAAVAAAFYAQKHGWGLFNQMSLPFGLELLVSLILLDLGLFGQHMAAHHIPFLWRFHKVHHCDLEVDVTTGLRFHPIEILFSTLWKIALVLLLGPLAFTVILFEIILNSCSMFNHSNLYIPPRFDRFLRLFLVTPDMHRIHHSTISKEFNSNFGFSTSLWDHLFKTHTPDPAEVMRI